ncbi:hypothetical protein MKW92_007497 [Papaver armeniacum]|nr:hypothetical protein MKW92_007497 [Papaver armeniacum]
MMINGVRLWSIMIKSCFLFHVLKLDGHIHYEILYLSIPTLRVFGSVLVKEEGFTMDEDDANSDIDVLLMFSYLLLFGTAGALFFIQALWIVGSHDTLLNERLVAILWAFNASGFCSALGMFICHFILPSGRENHLPKVFTLIIGTASAFLFTAVGYGLLILFVFQHP